MLVLADGCKQRAKHDASPLFVKSEIKKQKMNKSFVNHREQMHKVFQLQNADVLN